MCCTSRNVWFIIEEILRNDSWNSIHNTGEHHIKRIRLSEKNIDHECVEENTNSLCCSAEEETSESEMNGTLLNHQFLIAIRIVILNRQVNNL